MRFAKYVEQFKEYLIAKNYAGRTIQSYSFETTKFLSFIIEHYQRIKELSQVTKEMLNDYSSYLAYFKDRQGKPLSGKTQRLKIIAVKMFFRFLAKADFILKDPSETIELPKEEQDLPKNVLTQKEVLMILNAPDMNTPTGIRNKAVMELAYACGIRTSDLANLKIQDVDLKEQTIIIIKGKGGKTRLVPLTQYSVEYIKLYLDKARKFMLKGKINDEGYLFLSSRGNRFTSGSLNKSVIHYEVRKVNIKKKVTLYSMRHAVASHLIQNSVDIRYVQELLGHASLKTTQKYCHLDITDLKKVHSLCHPREKS